MTINVECGDCGTEYQLSDDKAGRKFRCRGCKAVVHVPDEWSDETYAPRRKSTAGKRNSSGAKTNWGLIIGSSIGAVLALGIVASFMMSSAGPEDTPSDVTDAPSNGNAVADSVSETATDEPEPVAEAGPVATPSVVAKSPTPQPSKPIRNSSRMRNARFVVSVDGNEHWLMTSPSGMAMGSNGEEGKFTFKGQTLRLQTKLEQNGVIVLQFNSTKPQLGDMVTLSSQFPVNSKPVVKTGKLVAVTYFDSAGTKAVTDSASVKMTTAPQPKGNQIANSIGMLFVPVAAGAFRMGTKTIKQAQPIHMVTLTQPFQMGVYEVTQSQFQRVMGSNPSHFKGAQNPVEQVNWDDAVGFCRKLSAFPKEKSNGYRYRLPTEAEWEYACRAGTMTDYSFGRDPRQLSVYAWFSTNSEKSTHPVGKKKPNPFGLYDMHGNVSEWCQDLNGKYSSRAVTDPTGATTGDYRVMRGGAWSHPPVFLKSALRVADWPILRDPIIGFRVVRVKDNSGG